jgi:hypothetical protein
MIRTRSWRNRSSAPRPSSAWAEEFDRRHPQDVGCGLLLSAPHGRDLGPRDAGVEAACVTIGQHAVRHLDARCDPVGNRPAGPELGVVWMRHHDKRALHVLVAKDRHHQQPAIIQFCVMAPSCRPGGAETRRLPFRLLIWPVQRRRPSQIWPIPAGGLPVRSHLDRNQRAHLIPVLDALGLQSTAGHAYDAYARSRSARRSGAVGPVYLAAIAPVDLPFTQELRARAFLRVKPATITLCNASAGPFSGGILRPAPQARRAEPAVAGPSAAARSTSFGLTSKCQVRVPGRQFGSGC